MKRFSGGGGEIPGQNNKRWKLSSHCGDGTKSRDCKFEAADNGRRKKGRSLQPRQCLKPHLKAVAFIVAPQSFPRRLVVAAARRGSSFILRGSKRCRCFWAERNETAKKQHKSIYSSAACFGADDQPNPVSPALAEQAPPPPVATPSLLFLSAFLSGNTATRCWESRGGGAGVRGRCRQRRRCNAARKLVKIKITFDWSCWCDLCRRRVATSLRRPPVLERPISLSGKKKKSARVQGVRHGAAHHPERHPAPSGIHPELTSLERHLEGSGHPQHPFG